MAPSCRPIARGRISASRYRPRERFRGRDVCRHENRPRAAEIGVRYKDMIGPPGKPFRPLHDERILFADQPVALVSRKATRPRGRSRDGARQL